MTDWRVSNKLDEVIEQNKQIILLLQMQIVSDTPNIDLHNLEKVTLTRIREEQQRKNQISRRNAEHARARQAEVEAKRAADREAKEKRIREEKLKEKNDEINHIIDTHNQISGSTLWMPSYENDDSWRD